MVFLQSLITLVPNIRLQMFAYRTIAVNLWAYYVQHLTSNHINSTVQKLILNICQMMLTKISPNPFTIAHRHCCTYELLLEKNTPTEVGPYFAHTLHEWEFVATNHRQCNIFVVGAVRGKILDIMFQFIFALVVTVTEWVVESGEMSEYESRFLAFIVCIFFVYVSQCTLRKL